MKRTYSKPLVVFESFTMSTNIAADCDTPFTLQAQFVCGIPDENGLGMNIFNPDLGGSCIVPGGDDARHDGFCYHIPTQNNQLFNS